MIVSLADVLRARRNIRAALVIAGGVFRGLVSTRGRRARIIRRPRWQAEFGFEFGNPRRQRLDLPTLFDDHRSLRGDGLRLGQNQTNQRLLVERFNCCAIHPKLESGCASNVQINPCYPIKIRMQQPREQLHRMDDASLAIGANTSHSMQAPIAF